MASVDASSTSITETATAAEAPKRRSRRRSTAHLKQVPEPKGLREQIRQRTREIVDSLPKEHPLTKEEMESLTRALLTDMGLEEVYVGWTMVMLSTAFWQDQVAAIPHSRRLFLLPHCLKHAEGCPADYDEFGLDCEKCGACSIADFRTKAEKLGYRVLVAEGSPIILKIIVSGYVDAIVGVACLNVLEKAIDKILLAGIPCMAVPLLSSDCRNTSVDEDWVHEMIDLRKETESTRSTTTYIHLIRQATNIFQSPQLERLVPRLRGNSPGKIGSLAVSQLDPIAVTEAVAFDFLAKGGKHSRPFITLAVHDALTGAQGIQVGGDQYLRNLSDSVCRTAISIETFHKASLVHDDIEDDDQHRYGSKTLHLEYGTPTAINIGDYLIGLGYRLVSRETAELGADVVADVLDLLADAHIRLTEGQGAELIWRDGRDKRLKPIDALKIYALKTAPAFEAAFFSGMRLAGPLGDYLQPIKQFARNLGVAFQILNDLKDWEGDSDNKMASGGDVLGGRPTLLLALALESLSSEQQAELLSLIQDDAKSAKARILRTRQLYQEGDVFEQARRLVDKHQQRAEAVADEIEPEPLRRLLYYLVDTVLDREQSKPPEVVMPAVVGLDGLAD